MITLSQDFNTDIQHDSLKINIALLSSMYSTFQLNSILPWVCVRVNQDVL
jgi:hypothetical protein